MDEKITCLVDVCGAVQHALCVVTAHYSTTVKITDLTKKSIEKQSAFK